MPCQSTNNMVPKDVITSSPDAIAYPRTGKRGVPQQFPRRLYTMLQSETADMTKVENYDNPLIKWSQSGRAFHISDIDLFSSHVLPKYFRTSKFSSFQRNLNLYGFSKVRKGPDMDMYAHPSFIQDRQDLLSQLKKCKHGGNAVKKLKQNCTSSGNHRARDEGTNSANTPVQPLLGFNRVISEQMGNFAIGDRREGEMKTKFFNSNGSGSRVVSPCSSISSYHASFLQGNPYTTGNVVFDRSQASFMNIHDNSLPQVSRNNSIPSMVTRIECRNRANQGKLDLLALAVECLAD